MLRVAVRGLVVVAPPHLRDWVARFRPRAAGTGGAPLAAELQHQRLYDPAFPGRWRAFVLAWIAGDAGDGGDGDSGDGGLGAVESRAIEAARARGLTLESLSAGQLAFWLTAAERELPDPAERFLRVLVRSTGPGMTGHARFADPAHAAALLNPRIDSEAEVRAAWRVNDEVAESAPHRSVHRLHPDLLAAHVAGLWRVPAEERAALDAAARDRGFSDAEGAIEAARAFFLHGRRAVAP